ncbi:hypothetical protein [Mesorhizobium sp. INR15]|uniref:hypothetical protein n=1 Tax=Mesorhizobium sp. INR15 TaxID=2654248 RepID=UPI001896A332|nr:hypothetical protein [Mesorhizobium sp. INR15]QPC90298.1 hypothetical protein GA829_06675 [Mesorhizobium sp. INR15]
MHIETRSIALTTPITAIHPDTGKPCEVVGVDESSLHPKLIILVTGTDGTHAETIDWVKNESPWHPRRASA